LEITEVRVKRVSGESKLRAMASIVFDGAFVVRDIRILESDKGLFVAMPSRKGASGEYYDIAYPITAEAREAIVNRVLQEYQRAS
jgi:stage V sporulation protein G